jgi:hypothetical protein
MVITNIRDVPTGILATVYTGALRCAGCGTVIFNASYEARATDEYTDAIDNRVRRKFLFEGGNPFCDCSDCIWLSSDDLPYVAEGWPVKVSVEIERCDNVDNRSLERGHNDSNRQG